VSSTTSFKSLLEDFDGDREEVGALLDLAIETVSEAFEGISRSLMTRERLVTQARAHSIKGCAGNIGAMELSRIAAEIEENSRNDHLAVVDVLLPRLKVAIAAFVDDVAAFKKETATQS
jgi:HPt (histidine-containing phosphotransfer) domain-containing protein